MLDVRVGQLLWCPLMTNEKSMKFLSHYFCSSLIVTAHAIFLDTLPSLVTMGNHAGNFRICEKRKRTYQSIQSEGC